MRNALNRTTKETGMPGLTKERAPVRRHVAFVINSLAGGGAERVMCTLLRASEEEGRDIDITLILLDQEPAAYAVPDWVHIEQLDCRHSFARSLGQLFGALRRQRPDVVLSFLTRANIAAALACRALGIPAVISERVNTSSHLGAGRSAALARLLVRFCYPLARKIIAVSPGVADDLVGAFGIARKALTVIANPVDLDGIRRQGDDTPAVAPGVPYVMAMGRLVPNKNFAMLIEAYAQAEMSEQLLILGEGPERANLQALIVRLGLEGRVHLPGFCANPYAVLKHAALFVLPSNAEGFPNSLLEAMTLRVPVVSTNCLSGPAEVLAEVARERVGEAVTYAPHGILVTPDNVAAMAAGLRAMNNLDRRASYADKAARRAADFSVVRAKNAYWDVLRAEIAPHEAAPAAALRAQ
jgi:N-acetylgalactosamine-N,N'-diacetylbacillosaminyl-diphospho-undecaprenol 4-alpha-N-acetylgalactosaminyltransferase